MTKQCPSYFELRLLPIGQLRSIREGLAQKLQAAHDSVGAQLLSAGFKIKKNKKRESILDETIKEHDSIKCLIVSQIFLRQE